MKAVIVLKLELPKPKEFFTVKKKYISWACSVEKDNRFPKIVLFSQPTRVKQKASCPQLGRGEVVRKDLREMNTFWESVKRGALKRLGCRKRVRSFVVLRRLGAAVSCY